MERATSAFIFEPIKDKLFYTSDARGVVLFDRGGLHPLRLLGFIRVLCRTMNTKETSESPSTLIVSASSSFHRLYVYVFVFSDCRAEKPRFNRAKPTQWIPLLWFRFTSPSSSFFIYWSFYIHTKTLEPPETRSMAMKRNGKSHVSSDSDEQFMSFKDVSLGPHEAQLRFRLIHFWEARNPVKKTLIGLEMLLIDEQVSRFFNDSFQIVRSIFPRVFDRLGFRLLF